MFIQIVCNGREVVTKQSVLPNFEQNYCVSAPEILQVTLIMILQGEGKRLKTGLEKANEMFKGRDVWNDCDVEEKRQPRESEGLSSEYSSVPIPRRDSEERALSF